MEMVEGFAARCSGVAELSSTSRPALGADVSR